MPWQLIVVGLMGASFGSLINVLSLRYGASHALLTDRSRCPACGRQLRWWELVPVISFLLLRGRCTHCDTRISWQYPLVELAAAAAWVWAFLPWPGSLREYAVALCTAAIISLLVLLFLIDRRLMLLPDIYLIYLTIFVVLRLWLQVGNVPQTHLAGLALGTGFLFLLWAATGGRGIGFGDIKLMLPLGLLFGFVGTLTVLWLAFIVGGGVAAYLLLSRKATMKTAVPFGPYLIGASVALLLWPSLPSFLFAISAL